MTLKVRWSRVVPAVLLVIGASSCAAARSSTGSSDRTVISRGQLDQNHFQTAYDAVEALHSNWLRTRGSDSFESPSEVKVYVDNSLVGGTAALRNIATPTISYLKYYDGVTATARWGVGHGAGVILVSTQLGSSLP